MAERIGLIGLGAMGLPIGKRLVVAGHQLTIMSHKRPEPALALKSLGATVVSSPADVAERSDVLITVLPDSPQVAEVLFGPSGAANALPGGALHIDMSTVAPSAAREHHRKLQELGKLTIDAPVSGGPSRAADGTLTIMVGGSKEALDAALPVLGQLGSEVIHVGPAGAGQVVKAVNQLMISMIMVANTEALTLGVRAGIPLETMQKVIGTSSGSNYLLQNWLPRTLFAGDLEHGFALDLLLKDVHAALALAHELKHPAPGGALAEQLFTVVRSEATSRLDYSVVATIYEQASGVRLRIDGAENQAN